MAGADEAAATLAAGATAGPDAVPPDAVLFTRVAE
jgi:hypothetical protein